MRNQSESSEYIMSVVSGYTLMLYCDCEECERTNYFFQIQEEYTSDTSNCKAECFKTAKKDGWRITKDYKCYASGHIKPKGKIGVLR